MPDTPGGGHRTHAGAAPDALTALPEDPPERERDTEIDCVLLPTPLDRVPPDVPVDAAPAAVAEPVAAAGDVDGAEAAGVA